MRLSAVREPRSKAVPTGLIALLLAGCATHRPNVSAPPSWRSWQAQRRESVAGTNGWTTVVGLHWLTEGRHSVGPDTNASISIATDGPAGELVRTGTNVWFLPAAGHAVTVDGQNVTIPIRLAADVPGPATKICRGHHQLWLLERGGRWAIRVRDPGAPARRDFRGLTYFPWQADWQIQARFELHPPGQSVLIQDVTGATKAEPNPGAVVFQHEGAEYRLEALEDAETGDLFILFRDATNGTTTYPPGRFLHAPYPDAGGRVILDFNRAYNPPCAFTEFATCPRPPAGNRLSFSVSAGEKKYEPLRSE